PWSGRARVANEHGDATGGSHARAHPHARWLTARRRATTAHLGVTRVKSVRDLSPLVPQLLELPEKQEVSVALPHGQSWRNGYRWYVEALHQCASQDKVAGLCYALETHPHYLVTTAMSPRHVIDDVNSSAVGANLDPSHLFPCGDLSQRPVYELSDPIFHTHLSDSDGQTNAHWRRGKGQIDWSELLAALHDVGNTAVLSIELEDVLVRAGAHHPVAGEAVDRENRMARDRPACLAEQLGIRVTWCRDRQCCLERASWHRPLPGKAGARHAR
ncbi:MAG TPA: TIM barrel protein, partial [Herpetosiphonaceae bacterium]|nr:TIM barrel protein [Herpetosiphonaceae bacterium]